ncbi:hypothetical protein HPP92_003983 [Vanilla planifolia]|uniref:WAT1-related protein n=1 Tax=Vanilla planifolia TaxID=51239 RepID=A0A835SCY2_VANPL|nr:hypothetical protein HPP92_003983 [Vanilla planifolia]
MELSDGEDDICLQEIKGTTRMTSLGGGCDEVTKAMEEEDHSPSYQWMSKDKVKALSNELENKRVIEMNRKLVQVLKSYHTIWEIYYTIKAYLQGIIGAGVTSIFFAYSIKKKGPLFVAVFVPLMLVFAAVLASFLLPEKLHLGSAIGSFFIITGLYLVLWGKRKEAATVDELPITNTDKQAVDEH